MYEMSDLVVAAFIGAAGAILAALVSALGLVLAPSFTEYLTRTRPQVQSGHLTDRPRNSHGRQPTTTWERVLLLIVVALLLTIGVFGLFNLSDYLKNAFLVAAITIVVVLALRRRDRTAMLKNRGILLILIPLGGAALGVGVSHARQTLAGPPPLSAPVCITNNFYPSGYMGDGTGENKVGTDPIDLNEQWTQNCHSGSNCTKIVYHIGQSSNWAGVYWLYPDGNWGDERGRAITGAKKLVFWTRGESGGEKVSFVVGGNDKKKYKDSLYRTIGPLTLTTLWEQHTFDLTDADTSSVIGAFAWSASAKANPNGLTFYVDGGCFTK
jgi:hypothetical protein